jgi:tetratricopeptide (TPR) repeat protein
VGPARLAAGSALSGLLLASAFAQAPPAPASSSPGVTPGVSEAIEAGDAHYARRAEGANDGTALPFHTDGALVEYHRALALDPQSLDARLRLMRAIFFRTGFCGEMEGRDKVRLLDEAKRIAEEAVAQIDASTGRGKARVPGGPAVTALASAEVYLWAAVSWGQWAVYHRISAAWQGAPKRIRDLAEAALSIDPATEQYGAYIILGRLHCEVPRVIGITGWVSCAKGTAFLRQGLAGAPDNQALVYFLADAIVKREASQTDEARALLQRCVASKPRSDSLVEDAHYAEQARRRLAGLR